MHDAAASLLADAAAAKGEGRFVDARELLRGAIDLLRQDGARLDLAQALRSLGEVERNVPESDGGVAAYQEAITLLREENVPLRLAHAIRHLGDIHRHHNDFERAAVCYDEAVSLYRSHPDAPPLDVANALRSAAILKERTGEAEQAAALWTEAWRLYQQAGVAAGVAESRARMAAIHSRSPDSRTGPGSAC